MDRIDKRKELREGVNPLDLFTKALYVDRDCCINNNHC